MALPVFYVFDICFNRFLQKLAETAALGIDSEVSGAWLELKHSQHTPLPREWPDACDASVGQREIQWQCSYIHSALVVVDNSVGKLYWSGSTVYSSKKVLLLNILKC